MPPPPVSLSPPALRLAGVGFGLSSEVFLRTTAGVGVVCGRVVKAGGQFSCAEAHVYDASGKLLASGRGTYFTAPPPPPKA